MATGIARALIGATAAKAAVKTIARIEVMAFLPPREIVVHYDLTDR
jgi:hypothetical protein